MHRLLNFGDCLCGLPLSTDEHIADGVEENMNEGNEELLGTNAVRRSNCLIVTPGMAFDLEEDISPYTEHGLISWKVVEVTETTVLATAVWPPSASNTLDNRMFDDLDKVAEYINNS